MNLNLEKEITSDAAIDFIRQGTIEKMKRNLLSKDRGGTNSLRVNMDETDNNLFDNKLNDLINSRRSNVYKILELDEETLKSLKESDIFIIDQRNIK